jgi:endonuclease I
MCKKILLLFQFVVISTTFLIAQIPEGYYDSANGLTGDALKLTLRNIITDGFVGISYGDSRYILDEADQDTVNPDNVLLVYLGTSVSGTWDAGVTWNREHVWPQSLLGVSVGNTTISVGSDLQNLKPANPSENSSRSNDYFDNIKTSDSYVPRDEVKGDVARILLYMTTRYDYLELVNSAPNIYEMAMLDVLLQWHIDDPVDDFERNRNDIIYSYQHNRNPYIDHPEFVSSIWGGTSITEANKNWVNVYPNPTSQNLYFTSTIMESNYQVLNILGQVLMQGALTEQTIETRDLPQGKYILILNSEQNVLTLPFVKINR